MFRWLGDVVKRVLVRVLSFAIILGIAYLAAKKIGFL